jgi:hypothetical protein
MSNLSVFDFNSNNIRFENREGRVWVCLTDMAKASGKQLGHWNTLKSTTEFLTVFESVIGIPITETVQGGQPTLQGTWAIEEVALEFAGWCSVKFKIWMLQQIKTLVTTGTVSLPQVVQPKLSIFSKKGAMIISLEKIRTHREYERAIMGVRFSDEFVGLQFHPEADPVSFITNLNGSMIIWLIKNLHTELGLRDLNSEFRLT